MRSSKKRSRSNQNRPRSLGNIVNRVFDSSGPEGKVRGTPQQIIEKYQTLARDAQLSNDRVAAENFLQHAEHYTRMLAEAQRELAVEQEARQQQYQQNGNQNSGGQNGNQNGGQNGNQNGGNRDYRERGERSDRGDRFDRNDGRNENRGEGRSDGRNEGRNEPRGERAPREENRQPEPADVIDFGSDSSGLVDLPESGRPAVADGAPDTNSGRDAADSAGDTPLFASARKSGEEPAAAPHTDGEARPPRAPRSPRGEKNSGKSERPANTPANTRASRGNSRRDSGEAAGAEASTVSQEMAPAPQAPASEPAAEGAKPRRASRPRKAAASPDTPEAAE